MPTPPTPATTRTHHWIIAFVALGVMALIFMATVPFMIGLTVKAERERFHACQNQTRTDCAPSFVWAVLDWSLVTATSTKNSTSKTATTSTAPVAPPAPDSEGTRMTRTSEQAPLITKATLVDLALENGWYRATIGATINITAEVTGAKTVAVYFSPAGDNDVGSTKIGTLTKKSDGTYAGSVKIPTKTAGFFSLEIRAIGTPATEQSSVFMNVSVK